MFTAAVIIVFVRIAFYAIFLVFRYCVVGPPPPAPRKWPLRKYIVAHVIRYLLTLSQSRPATFMRDIADSPDRARLIERSTPPHISASPAKFPRLGADDGLNMTDLGWSREENEEGGFVHGEWVKKREDVDRDGEAFWARKRVVIVLHGGGFTMGSAIGNRGMSVQFVDRVDAVVLAIDYRLSPEYPFPAALQDVVSCYVYLIRTLHIPANNIIFAGDSAGANLSLTTVQWLRDHPIAPMPACCILFSAPMDPEGSSPSHFTNFETGTLLRSSKHLQTLNNIAWLVEDTIPFGSFAKSCRPGHRLYAYYPDIMITHPYIAPVYCSFKPPAKCAPRPLLPPMMNIVGGLERLRDDGFVFGIKMDKELREMKEDGVLAEADLAKLIYTCDVFEDDFHVFQATFPDSAETHMSYNRIANFVLAMTTHCEPISYPHVVTSPKPGVSFYSISETHGTVKGSSWRKGEDPVGLSAYELSIDEAKDRVIRGFDEMQTMGFKFVLGGVGSFARTVARF
ncbi:hypothetical protein HDU93_009479 [Gonapodya sp. JEL0774]|nr:hypothetical protein HDU93_009479 [Gonapodya sp. JEL0774]